MIFSGDFLGQLDAEFGGSHGRIGFPVGSANDAVRQCNLGEVVEAVLSGLAESTLRLAASGGRVVGLDVGNGAEDRCHRRDTNGLGGGNELVGGLWVLLVSIAGWRTRALPRALNAVGIVSAAAGLITVIPGFEDVGMVFGLGLIVWFAWLGTVLLRAHRNADDGDLYR